MSARKVDPANKTRIQIVCSRQQREIIEAVATGAGTDLSTWVLAHSLRAASQQAAVSEVSAPLVVAGRVADQLRALANKQGVPPDKLLEQLLILGA